MTDVQRSKKLMNITYKGIVVNIVLIGLKFFAGFTGKSAAMIADAVHSLSDFISDIIVLVFVRIASKPDDDNHRYGHGKFETFATLIVGIILIVVGILIFYDGIMRMYNIFYGINIEKPHLIALYMAVVSIIAKEILFWYTLYVGKRLTSDLVIANAWHHRSDAFSSIATALGISGAIFLGEKWRILDPLAAVIVSGFILRVGYKIIIPAFRELLEQSLPANIRREIISIVEKTEHVSHPISLKTRNIGNTKAIEIHVKMDNNMTVEDSHTVTMIIEAKLKERYGNQTQVVVHVEPKTEKIV